MKKPKCYLCGVVIFDNYRGSDVGIKVKRRNKRTVHASVHFVFGDTSDLGGGWEFPDVCKNCAVSMAASIVDAYMPELLDKFKYNYEAA